MKIPPLSLAAGNYREGTSMMRKWIFIFAIFAGLTGVILQSGITRISGWHRSPLFPIPVEQKFKDREYWIHEFVDFEQPYTIKQEVYDHKIQSYKPLEISVTPNYKYHKEFRDMLDRPFVSYPFDYDSEQHQHDSCFMQYPTEIWQHNELKCKIFEQGVVLIGSSYESFEPCLIDPRKFAAGLSSDILLLLLEDKEIPKEWLKRMRRYSP